MQMKKYLKNVKEKHEGQRNEKNEAFVQKTLKKEEKNTTHVLFYFSSNTHTLLSRLSFYIVLYRFTRVPFSFLVFFLFVFVFVSIYL